MWVWDLESGIRAAELACLCYAHTDAYVDAHALTERERDGRRYAHTKTRIQI